MRIIREYDDQKKREAEDLFRLVAENASEEEAQECIQETELKINKLEKSVPEPLLQLWGDIRVLYSLLKDYLSGEYKEVPWKIIAAVVGALLYFVSPVDAIPDFIPGVGYVDDAGVIVLCLKMVEEELENYKIWLMRQ